MDLQKFREDPSFYAFIAARTIFIVLVCFAYGAIAQKNRLFPIPQIVAATHQVTELFFPDERILFSHDIRYAQTIAAPHSDRLAAGLLMIAGVHQGRNTFVRIIDRDGNPIHEWIPVWDEVWANEGSFPAGRRPAKGRGMYLHGIDLLPDLSIVANFEHLSTFRMDVCGQIVWKRDNLGHHSVHYSDQGELWVTAERYVAKGGDTGYPNHVAPLRSWTIQKLGQTGEILREIELIDLLQRNDRLGLLSLSSLRNSNINVSGDTLHLNDVDVFPANMPSEVFAPGDVMVSLRNINTILVFDPETLKIKFISTGRVLRHHDPDFIANDRISVFDNRNRTPAHEAIPAASRIVEINARTGETRTILDGQGEHGFFTQIMGVHQRLPNGNILVTSSGEGRVLEYLPDGQLAWRYSNRYSSEQNGRVFIAKLLPPQMDKALFEARKAQCHETKH